MKLGIKGLSLPPKFACKQIVLKKHNQKTGKQIENARI